jgi:ankyrin repeat protein
LAEESSYAAVVEDLIDHHAVVDVRDERRVTALHLAAHGNHFAEVQSIVKHRAEFNAQDGDELTVLNRAASEGYDTVVGVDARNDDSHTAMTAPEYHRLSKTCIIIESQQTKEVFKYDNLSKKDHIRVAVIDPGTLKEVLKVALY